MARVRHGRGRLFFWGWLVTMWWGLSLAAWGAGAGVAERDFVRRTTAPVVESMDFSGQPGSEYILTIYNGGREGQYDLVTSALITVNGVELFVPDHFKQQVPLLQRRLTFADSNRLTVELRSKPDSGLTIVIEPVQKAPTIVSPPPEQGLEDALYQYAVQATDPNGDALRFALVTAPAGMQLDADTGVIRWIPVNDDVGSHPVVIRVEDTVGLSAEQAYTLTILNVNDAPVISSSPLLLATEDQPYLYDVTAGDADAGDVLTYRLLQAPTGMSIEAASGRISWTPFNADVGEHEVQVVVTDLAGATAVQSFRIQVANTNDAPLLLTTTLPAATEHLAYSVQLAAIDEDVGDQLTVRLENAPAGMTVDAATGVISWLPGTAFGGQRLDVTVIVTDLAGAQDSRVLALEVINTNDAPLIESSPPLTTPQFGLYQYQLVVSDPDAGDTQSFALASGPAGMTLSATGLLTWQPQGQETVADHPVTLTVTDSGGLTASQTFVLVVTDVNDAPVITSTPVLEATATLPYRYLVTATDVDSDVLSFALLVAPAGMTLSAEGEVAWLPGVTAVGQQTVRVQVRDGEGGQAEQYFVITVAQPPRQPLPPMISSSPTGTAAAGEWFRYQTLASDPNPGDVLTYAGLGGADGYQVSPTGLLEWLADPRYADAMVENDVSCRLTSLPTGVVEPVLRWHWTGGTTSTTYNQVMAAPVVAPLQDSNGDGVVDVKDAPAILFASFRSTFYQSAGVLRAVDGATGVELWSRSGIVPGSTPAVGDLDRDGRPDIVIYEFTSLGAQVTALDASGDTMWTTAEVIHSGGMGAPTLADLEGDGEVEILAGPRVFRADGTLKWRDASGYATAYNAIAADLDLDGQQEVIVGGSAYRANGTRLFKNDTAGGGFTAVGNFNADDYPEIVVVAGGKVTLLNRLGAIQWSRALPGSASLGGPPTIADVDNDGRPEIGVASRIYYSVLNTDGTIRWNRSVQDTSSQSTGSTAMDLDGDGLMEIAYADELNLRIYNADSGHVLYQIPNPSGTLREYPVFADVDGDGHGDLIVVGNTLYSSGPRGVRVFSGKNNGWVKTRALWSQYAYSIDNINDDLSVPAQPARGWLSHNTYRLNSSPVFTSLPDVQVDNVVLDQGRIRATVRNRGFQAVTTPVTVNLALGDEAAPAAVAQTVLASLPARSAQAVEFAHEGMPVAGVVQVEATAPGVEECRYGNNRARAPLFTVKVTDSDGLSDQQTFALSVREAPVAPVFVSTPPTSVRAGFLYRYLAEATDANAGDGRTYRLTTRPQGMSISPYTGLISWLPTQAQAGNHPVVITATDASGLVATQSYTLSVLGNLAPVITSTAPATAVTGHAYSYQVVANDPEGDTFTYSLTAAQTGMSINGQTGLVSWMPTTAGTRTFTVSVLDALGAASTQTVTVQVTANMAPAFTSTPVTVAYVGSPYRYRAQAIDAEGDGITYSLTTPPSGMTIVVATGEVAWTPTLAQMGQYTIKVNARDSVGATTTQTFTLTARSNVAPVITSQPTFTFASLGAGWSYQLTASDADGDALVFSLVSGPAGLSVTPEGLVSWIPAPDQQGPQTLVLRVSDGQLSHEQTLTITGITGTPPQIGSVPPVTAKAGRAWGYQVQAQDPDGHALAYSLRTAPAGMIVSGTGLLSWLPGSAQVGSHPVVLRVADNESYAEQAFTVTVLAADVPLAVMVTAQPQTLNPGETATISLVVSGAASEVTRQVTVNGQPLALLPAGNAYFTPTTPGRYTVVATVSDGHDSASATLEILVRDPADATAPVVSIHSPQTPDRVTAPVDVIASIIEPNLQEYLVAISPAGRQQYTVIARGTAPVSNGIVARFDPTLLTNGLWDIVVQATDLNGLTGSEKVTVRVKGDLKLGHFSFTVTDVEVPLAGIPIRVTRTYDTRRRSENLDFGHGWSVGYQDGKVDESRPLGQYWDLNEYRSGPLNSVVRYCVEPRGKPVVTVTLPTGAVETFEVTVNNPCALYQPVIDGLSLVFTPVDNTLSTLVEVNPLPLRLVNGQLVDNAGFALYDPARYTLTTKAGYVYTLDQGFGILKFQDPNGNTVTYTPNGILHSSGLSVVFERGSDGRINAIRDPNGNVRRYSYDARGDLTAAAEPVTAGSPAPGASTAYTYYGEADGFAHYLDEIRDPLGRKLLKNLYNADGRLVAQEDGNGQRIEFSHNLSGRTSVVTNRRGYATQFAYDEEGRILTQIDALNGVTTNAWDARGNLLTKTNANNEVTSATYNDRNDQLTQTDGEGHTTTYTHNLRGQELTVSDARQNRYAMAYDTVGNLLTLTDPLDQVTGNVIGAKGLLTSTTNALNQATRWTYDSEGRKQTETNALGHVTRWTYDTNGNVLTESRTRTVNGAAVTETVTHAYDSRNRRVRTTDALGNVTRIEYDLAGQESARIDALGRRTEMDHDAYGRLTATRYPDGTTETHGYDAEGNKTRSTDRLGRTTTYEYDALNRLVKTTLADGSSTRTEFDAVGRATAEVDARNHRTEYDYDGAGHRTQVRNALGQERTFGYDADGNLVSDTDALAGTTTYTLDALDRRTQVTYADGAVEKTVYDALGRVTEKEDALQRKTTYGYDAGGRLTEVKDHRQQVTGYGYDEAGNKIRQTDALQRSTTWTHDANGNVLRHMLPLGQSESFTYDPTGQVATHTDFNGQLTQYLYDLNGREAEVRHADGGKVVTTYNAVGNRVTVVDTQPAVDGSGLVTQTTTYAYDLQDRLTTQTNPDNSGLAYEYDASGNRTKLTATYPDGTSSVTDYSFDALSRLATVTGPEGLTVYGYDPVGNRTSLRPANGTEVRYRYDARHRLTRQEHFSPSGVVTQRYDYTLDATGRRTRVEELDGRVTTYGYDDLYRLESETQSGGTLPAYSASYQYDAVGNRTYSIVDGVHTAYAVDANDRLTQQGGETYSYDAAGNTLTHTRDGQTTTYAYDARQRLLSTQGPAGTAQYGYDADGNRIHKTEGGQRTQYLIDSVQDHAQVVAELANGAPQVRYTLGDERLSRQDASGAFRFYETDGHGSVRALTDSAGEATDSYAYDAFGTLLTQTGSTANDFRYTGEQFDATSGLYYLRARHYSPYSGRFTQRDTWAGHAQEPITLHKYVYGNSDPVTHIDPSGRFSLVEMGVTETIRTELTSLQIDTGFSLLDNLTNGASEQFTGPLAQINQAKMLAVAMIGSGSLLKMLSKKFRSSCNSFDGETLVHTRQGLVPIREIRIGDEVLAFNEATGQEEYSPVVHLIRSDKEQGWVDVTTAGGEVIQATAEHPFYAKSANNPSWQWLDASQLLQGLELYTAANEADEVAGTRGYLTQRPAYNLTVDRTHTYFVGKDGVLVHNSACGWTRVDLNTRHIFGGDARGGWHHRPGGLDQPGNIIERYVLGKENTSPNKPYKAIVRIKGGAKGKGGTSSFFPDGWSRERVENEIKAIVMRKGKPGIYTENSTTGFPIKVVVEKDGERLYVVSAYPDI